MTCAMSASNRSKLLILAVILAYLFFGFTTMCFGLTAQERVVVGQMKDAIGDLRGQLEAAQAANASALEALTESARQAGVLVTQAKEAGDRAAAMASERDTLLADLSRFEIKHRDLNSKYQRAQFIIALAAGIIAALLALQFTHNLQPPYGLIVPIAAGAAAFFGTYMIL
jgi:hypothetical protein